MKDASAFYIRGFSESGRGTLLVSKTAQKRVASNMNFINTYTRLTRHTFQKQIE